MKSLSSTSSWPAEEIETFLSSYRAPLRLAVQTASGFPLLCSLWFVYEKGRILCATQRDAKLVEHLAAQPRCAFELAPNEPPYFGVRGRGVATISSDGAAELLGRLIDRFLGDRESSLAGWLLGRADQEVCIAIELDRVTSWDYRDRMSD